MHPTKKEQNVNAIASISPTSQLGKIGIILACLGLLVPLCSLPPTRLGYYRQVETCLISFWGLSGVVSLWIYALRKEHPRLVYHTFRLPVVWGSLVLGIATLLISPFHVLPLRDFTGSPHISEGSLTFIASGVMISLFSILTRIPIYRKIIFMTALLVGLTMSALTILGTMGAPFISWQGWQWAPYFFPDFLAFIDIALAALYLYGRKDFKAIYLNDTLALIIFAFITYYASNKSLGYGICFSILSTALIWLFPTTWPAAWKRHLLHFSFFGLSFALTLLIVFYDDFSKILPESLKFLGGLSTITSRTCLSVVTFVDLGAEPLSWQWIKQLLIGKGWGTFSDISASNMFLIDQVSLFSGKEYNPSWELVSRDLLHTHNVLTNYFHSLGLLGLSLYLYVQYKLINSLPQRYFLIGTAFLIAYQVQLLFWFQLMITIPLTLLASSVLFRKPTPTISPYLLKPGTLLGFAGFLLVFAGLQGIITWGHEKGKDTQSITKSVNEFIVAPHLRLEAYFGSQRQVGLARFLATTLQKDFEKDPQNLVKQSFKLVTYLMDLPKAGNYLANNVAINILSELASKPEVAVYFSAEIFKTWERLAREHMELMPYRSDILLPFFNFYQTLGKEAIVLDLTEMIYTKNPKDPIALWFIGSSLLKNPARFDESMCMLQKAVQAGVERFMPVPPPLKSKIMAHATLCP